MISLTRAMCLPILRKSTFLILELGEAAIGIGMWDGGEKVSRAGEEEEARK